MLPELDPLLHSQLRLAVMSTLVSRASIRFPELFKILKDSLNATTGNLSVQMKKLEKAGYLTIEKGFHNNYPMTTLKITEKGLEAFENYVEALSKYLPK